ncbi:MAG: Flp pilus assembly protein CpaB [Armatimonadota bacterium]|nr:MAG: Flp pilus assembly protein CpaB [Armatimonadota bacterium]
MSKLTRRGIVLAALCAGLAAALLAYLFLTREKARAAEMTEPVQVVVAAQDIPLRTVIEPGMVREATRPIGTLPANSATSMREVMGRVTITALAADEPVQRAAVAPRTASLGLAYVVPEGMRAVTVALDPIIGVAGFLKAGDHVDVLATFEVDKVSVTKTVLQDLELLAIGAEVLPEEVDQPKSDKAARPKEQPNATLALDPADAEKLILAESKGRLRLTLRPVGDIVHVALDGVRSDALIGIRSESRSGAAPAQPTARVLPAAYTSPAFAGGYPRFGSGLYSDSGPESKPQPVTFSNRVKIGEDAYSAPVTVETVRGTQKSTVDVRPE